MEPVPLERSRHRRRLRSSTSPGFSMVQLNLVGWSALAGAGLAVGLVLFLVTHLNVFVALPAGVALVWGTLALLDRRRWQDSTVHRSRDDMTPEAGREIVGRLQRLGIEASYFELPIDEEDGGGTARGIRCRQRDADQVARVTEEVLG
jgi:hypothetical protein